MTPPQVPGERLTRRAFLGRTFGHLGPLALGTLLPGCAGMPATPQAGPAAAWPPRPHFAPSAQRVLCLFQSGGLSHVDLFEDKPSLRTYAGQDLPPSVKGTQRVTGMTSHQDHFLVAPPIVGGRRCGRSGLWLSDLLPHLQTVADELCMVKTVVTDAINHDPAITFLNTGNQQPGYASMGAWASYGLGSANDDLPTFVAMVSQGSGKNPGQPIFSRLWGSGFLPSSHQGVAMRPGGNPVPFLADPDGITRVQRRDLLDDLAALNERRAQALGDPDSLARVQAYEMAFRMQASVPELTDLADETAATRTAYGPAVDTPGSYAANCLLARRLLERGVRFVQLFHRGWDQHVAIQRQLPRQCRDVDQPTAALLHDLRRRGLLDDTLVLFVTEFGRTVYSQGKLDDPGAGRDHHGRCFTVWLAGAGVRRGHAHGSTDDFCYNVAADAVPVRDLHATLLHCLGLDHARLTFPFRGLDTRLTGVEPARVVTPILA